MSYHMYEKISAFTLLDFVKSKCQKNGPGEEVSEVILTKSLPIPLLRTAIQMHHIFHTSEDIQILN